MYVWDSVLVATRFRVFAYLYSREYSALSYIGARRQYGHSQVIVDRPLALLGR